MIKNLPIYKIVPPEMDDPESGMLLVSLVENPAVEEDFLAFAKEETLQFKMQDEEKHIITGISIKADTPIYRRIAGGECYVVFEKNDIPKIVEKFFSEGLNNFISLQHNEKTMSNKDAILVESYFINKERGIVPVEFSDVPDGSWVTSYKILNEDIWDQVKNGDVKGFSIEISANLEEVKFEKQLTEDEELIEMMEFDKKKVATPNIEDVVIAVNPDLNTLNEESIRYAIGNQKVVMINYKGNEASGSRQCVISAYGQTTAGNDAIRVYQEYGDTMSTNSSWKLLLLEDITEFHVVDFLTANVMTIPGWDGGESMSGENGTMPVVYYQIM